MHSLRHFYYQNKEKIWKVVLIIAFLLALIYFLNGQAENKSKNINTSDTNTKIDYSDEEKKTYISETSSMSGGKVTQSEVNKINNTIGKFLQYCKEGNSEQAYNMLSADCKEIEYQTLTDFQNKYLTSKFNKESVYEIEPWINDTYKISISKDLLATGDVKNNEKQIEYITIVKENSQEKLNINSYIGKEDINKEQIQNNIKITVLSVKKYMDYEIYDFNIENLSNKTIKMDTLKKIGTMYLKDSNDNKYNAQINEILEDELEIKTKHQFNLSIKFANRYSKRVRIESIVFENIILDYAKYKLTENQKEFKEICKMEIEL